LKNNHQNNINNKGGKTHSCRNSGDNKNNFKNNKNDDIKVSLNKSRNRNGGHYSSSNDNETTSTSNNSSTHSAKIKFAHGVETDDWNDAASSYHTDVLGLMVQTESIKNSGVNKIKKENDELIVDSGATLHIFRDITSVSKFLPERLSPTQEIGIRGIDNNYHPQQQPEE
jgi:hypothetical protein